MVAWVVYDAVGNPAGHQFLEQILFIVPFNFSLSGSEEQNSITL
jgi:hypothetical protein